MHPIVSESIVRDRMRHQQELAAQRRAVALARARVGYQPTPRRPARARLAAGLLWLAARLDPATAPRRQPVAPV